jgi:LysM repeat protein
VEVKPVETRPIVPHQDVPPPAPAPAPAVDETTIYIVQPGDYLAKISKKFNIKISAIKSLNGLTSDKIRVGQKLKLPGKVDVGVQSAPKAATPAAAKAPAVKKEYKPYDGPVEKYTVKDGDFLGKIAAAHKISVRQLKEMNKLSSDSLKVGQKLDVPAKGGVAAKAPEVAKKDAVEEKKAEPAPVQNEAPGEDAAVEEAPVAAPAPVSPAVRTYEVKEGESLNDISASWGVVPNEIRELNKMGEDDDVKPGQIIKLPASAVE